MPYRDHAAQSLTQRLLRGAGITTLGFVLAQGLRFGSNLILARLLFPEAFGLMALVSVFLVGAAMMSDAGIGQSVRQSPRGDDPAFLRTAWTMQVLRGLLLFALVTALAWPAAWLYEVPDLRLLLPVAAVTLLLTGFEPIKAELAYRHLSVARVVLLDLVAQIVGIVVMVGLAWAMGSVWALVIGMVAASACKLLLYWLFLPGPSAGFGWDRGAASELFRFGIWIFLSSVFGFLLSQGDKAIFGVFLSLQELGLYNIAYFLASFPSLLAGAVIGSLLLPAYRIALEQGDGQLARLRRLRLALTGGIMAMLAALAVLGPWLVELLYDDRYLTAGQFVTWIALAQMWPLIGLTYDQAALAAGDSRGFFRVIALRAVIQTLCFVLGMMIAGLPGALAGQVVASVIVHAAIVGLARRHQVWDMYHDGVFALFAVALGLLIV